MCKQNIYKVCLGMVRKGAILVAEWWTQSVGIAYAFGVPYTFGVLQAFGVPKAFGVLQAKTCL